MVVIAARFLNQKWNFGIEFVCFGDLHHFVQHGLVLNHGEMPFLLVHRAGCEQSRHQYGIQCVLGYLPGIKAAYATPSFDNAQGFIDRHGLPFPVRPDRSPAFADPHFPGTGTLVPGCIYGNATFLRQCFELRRMPIRASHRIVVSKLMPKTSAALAIS